MHGTGHADDLVGLQMNGNKADAVPCERLPKKSLLLAQPPYRKKMASFVSAHQNILKILLKGKGKSS